jgi:hypothetical protein
MNESEETQGTPIEKEPTITTTVEEDDEGNVWITSTNREEEKEDE